MDADGRRLIYVRVRLRLSAAKNKLPLRGLESGNNLGETDGQVFKFNAR